MKFQVLSKAAALALTGSLILSGCGGAAPAASSSTASQSSAPASSTAENATTSNGEKRTFIIYNVAGAPGYHEQIVLEGFKKEFGDKYEIQYETIGGADAVTKIESQGLKKGDGNVNIVIMGDSEVVKGVEAGIFSDLSVEKDALKLDDLTDIGQACFAAYDNTALPISIEPNQPAIAYMPATAKGARLDAIVGEDGGISFEELKQFMLNDPEKPVMGRGRISKSGPGDIWTYGLIQQKDSYGAAEVPQNSIDWIKPLYENKQIALYDGTGATFKDMTEGNIDIVPHSLSWFYRLYALKLADATLPDELKVDSLGLENAKFAYMTDDNGKPLDAIIGTHYYSIPANLSEEDYAASMEFMKWLIRPEMNANVLTVLTAPSYKSATPDKITDESVKTVWGEVEKYYPAAFLEDQGGMKVIKTTDRSYQLSITDVGIVNTYFTAWQEQLETLIG